MQILMPGSGASVGVADADGNNVVKIVRHENHYKYLHTPPSKADVDAAKEKIRQRNIQSQAKSKMEQQERAAQAAQLPQKKH